MFPNHPRAHIIVIASYRAQSDVTCYSLAYWFFGFNLPSNVAASYPMISPRPCVYNTNLLINTNTN